MTLKEIAEIIRNARDFTDDTLTTYKYWREIHKTGKKLVNEFGENVGAGADIDNYYHPLLQCVLAQKGRNHQQNGINLGYWKEVADEYLDSNGKM